MASALVPANEVTPPFKTATIDPARRDEEARLYRVLTLLSFATRTAAEDAELSAGIKRVDAQTLGQLISENALTVWAIKQVQATAPILQLATWSAPWPQLVAEAATILERATKRDTVVHRVLSAATRAGVDVMLLKGAWLGATVYRDAAYKKMNDIDVLVRPEAVPTFVRIMEAAGLRAVGSLFHGVEADLEKNHHLSPYVSDDLSCVLGVHWGLASPYALWHPDHEAIWRRAILLRGDEYPLYQDLSVWIPSNEDGLLHLCMHLPFYKTGLRELCDVYNLVRKDPIDWDLVRSEGTRWGIESSLYRVLSLSRAVSGIIVPPALMDAFEKRSDGRSIADAHQRIGDPARLHRSRCVHVGRIEKAFAFFRLSSATADKTRALAFMWGATLWPPAEEIAKILALPHGAPTPWWRKLPRKIRTARRLWLAMARDYGQIALVYMTAANVCHWLASIWRALVTKQATRAPDPRLIQLQGLLE